MASSAHSYSQDNPSHEAIRPMTYLTTYTGSLRASEPIPQTIVRYLDFLRHRDAGALDAEQLRDEASGRLRDFPVDAFLCSVSGCNVRGGFFTVNSDGHLIPPDEPSAENAQGWLWLITAVFLRPLGITLTGRIDAQGQDDDDVWTLGLDSYQVPATHSPPPEPWITPADRLLAWLQGSPTARRRLTNTEVDALIDKLEHTPSPKPPQLKLWSVEPVGGPSTATLRRRQDPVRRTDWWRNEDYLRSYIPPERVRQYLDDNEARRQAAAARRAERAATNS
jgi:hypothetical protein